MFELLNPKDGTRKPTSFSLLINGSALTVSYIGSQYGLNQEFFGDLYNVKIGNQVPTICVQSHESLAEKVGETVEKFSGGSPLGGPQ